MTRAATHLVFAGAIAAVGLAFGGCGASDGGSQASSTDSARTATTRQAAGAQGVKLVCPEKKSKGSTLSITNGFKDRKIYPVMTGVDCNGWSGTGNPGYMNGEEIQPGQTLKLHVEEAQGAPTTSTTWTMDVGQTTVASLDPPVTVRVWLGSHGYAVRTAWRPNETWSCRARRVPDSRGGFISVSPACDQEDITIGPG